MIPPAIHGARDEVFAVDLRLIDRPIGNGSGVGSACSRGGGATGDDRRIGGRAGTGFTCGGGASSGTISKVLISGALMIAPHLGHFPSLPA